MTDPSRLPGGQAGKEGFIRRLFDTITPRYDLFNRLASLGLDRAWRQKTIEALELKPGMRVLDLASGTGDLALSAARRMLPLGTVAACDLSFPMLRCSTRRMSRSPFAGWHVRPVQGRAEQLPFSDGAFDAATIGFALRNVSDLSATFRELRRVLAPGGRLALLEFGRPGSRILRAGQWLWLTFAVPLIGLACTGRLWPFLYLRRSILQFMPPEEVCRLLRAAGFSRAEARPLTAGVAVLYKH